MFIKQVQEQLKKMSEKEKEEWILVQAKLLHQNQQRNFLMTLTGEKKVLYMPSLEEIEAFCKNIDQNKVHLEYETQYFEFNEDGKYIDDWKEWHNDPYGIMEFLDKVLRGCQDLLLLNEYKTVADIIDRIMKLVFKVIESPNSCEYADGFDTESTFSLVEATEEGMLSKSTVDIGTTWITAYIYLKDEWDGLELAHILIEIFKHPLCKKLDPSMLIGEKIPKDLFSHMFEIINELVIDAQTYYDNTFGKIMYSREKYRHRKKLTRLKQILLNIKWKCVDESSVKTLLKSAVLATSWEQIEELHDVLRSDDKINGQWEIDVIHNICKALLNTNDLWKEDWKLRKYVLSDMIQYDYYKAYGCYDLMFGLSKKLCVTSDEFLEFADIMYDNGRYKKEAALLYRKYGQEAKYVAYLKTHLDKDSETYVALIDYYKKYEKIDEARQVAEQALAKCRNDLTDTFIFLLIDAINRNDKEKYKKLYSSAKRRRMVDTNRVELALTDFKRK